MLPIVQILNDLFRIKHNQYWLYFMINNFFIILLLTYIILEINRRLTGKKCKNYQITIVGFIFSMFWKGYYHVILANMFFIFYFYMGYY